MKYQIYYLKMNGAKDNRTFKGCTGELDAINKLLQYIPVKRILSIYRLEEPAVIPFEKPLFNPAQVVLVFLMLTVLSCRSYYLPAPATVTTENNKTVVTFKTVKGKFYVRDTTGKRINVNRNL